MVKKLLKIGFVDSQCNLMNFNLFVTSKNETTNSPIHELKVLQNVFRMKTQGLKCFLK